MCHTGKIVRSLTKRAVQHAELLKGLTMYNNKVDQSSIYVPAGTVVCVRRSKEHKVSPTGAVVYNIEHYYQDECFTFYYISIRDDVDREHLKILDLTKKGGDK